MTSAKSHTVRVSPVSVAPFATKHCDPFNADNIHVIGMTRLRHMRSQDGDGYIVPCVGVEPFWAQTYADLYARREYRPAVIYAI